MLGAPNATQRFTLAPIGRERRGEGVGFVTRQIQPLKFPSTMPNFLTLFKAVQTY
jgi:hypothetical protein